MVTSATRQLEGSGSRRRLAALRAKFRRASRWRGVGKLLLAYWFVCLSIIGFGLDRLHPEVRSAAVERLVTLHGERPFANCTAAHTAGVYDIPTWSRAYTERQTAMKTGLPVNRRLKASRRPLYNLK